MPSLHGDDGGNMFDLTGMTALVTGASGGIGSAIAQALAAAGRAAGRLGLECRQIGGVPRRARRRSCRLAVQPFRRRRRRCARAAGGRGARPARHPRQQCRRHPRQSRHADEGRGVERRHPVNLEAAFRLARAALKPMMRARHGRIISITSVVGATGNPGQANYAASKAGLVGMSKALAQEVASRGITVNCIAPGFIASAMTDALPDAQKETLLGRIPAGRLGEGADVAAAAVYLASREAAYVTGQTLHVNGGMAML